MSSVPKTTAQRLEHWKAVLGQYDYTIQHVAGERNCWGDLLSRWVNVPSVSVRSLSVRSVAVFMPSKPDVRMPSKQVVREAQQASRAQLGDSPASESSFKLTIGQVDRDDEGLYRVTIDGRDVLWIPGEAKDLQVRPHDMCSNEGSRPPWYGGDVATAARVLLLGAYGRARTGS